MTFWCRTQTRLLGLLLATAVLPLLTAMVRAEDKKAENSAVKPSPKDVGRHEGFVALAKKGHVDVVFLGDSITDAWRTDGKEVWKTRFEPLRAVNFGIGGDRTQHVLWRIQNGELKGIHPKAVVLMIGTNNLGSNTNEQIAEGIETIVNDIHHQQPHTKVLLLGIFPRGAKATDKIRDRIKDINKMISKLDNDGKTVRYLDIGDKFLDEKGDLPKDIMPDALHLSAKGYKIEADAIQPALAELMK
jgi:lysophospholipase L1-like esterase